MVFLVYPGTVIEWLPLVVSNVFRVIFWAGILVACIWMATNAIKYPSPRAFTVGRAALFVMLMQQALLNAERWGQPITYETLLGVPALTLTFVALIIERRARVRVGKK